MFLSVLVPLNVNDSQSHAMLANMQNLMTMNNDMMRSAVDAVQYRDMGPVVNLHYDNLLYVEGNVDKDFSQTLLSATERISRRLQADMGENMRKLGWQRIYK